MPIPLVKIPLVPDWWKYYKREDFRFDLIAGLTVAVMLIPQGMAYAIVAGMPPVYGLYASTLPAMVYAWFGTARQLSVGPGALTALLTAAGIGMLAAAGSEQYFVLVTMVTITVGLIQVTLGFAKLGFLINFLSNPVMVGFTSAAVILIGMSQLKHLLGITLIKSQQLQTIIADLITQIETIHWVTTLVGISSMLIIMLFRKFRPKWPAPLMTVCAAILITWLLRLDLKGLYIVGHIPGGWPLPQFTGMTTKDFMTLLPTAGAIALVCIMESTAIARTMQARHRNYEVIPNRELVALGLANLMSGLIKSVPVTGGMSRSTVNDQAGALTGMSSFVSAGFILLMLLFFTPLLYFLPTAVLAAVIILAVANLFKWKEAKRLWMLDRKDFSMALATFLGTLFMGIGPGIGLGVLLSLVRIIYEASYPHHAELGKVPGTHFFRNTRRFKNLLVLDGVLFFRFDAPLFFANSQHFHETIDDYRNRRKDKIHTIVLDMASVSSIDSTAIDELLEIIDALSKENIRLVFTDVKGPVRDKLFVSGLTEKVGEKNFFATNEDAFNQLSGSTTASLTDFALQHD